MCLTCTASLSLSLFLNYKDVIKIKWKMVKYFPLRWNENMEVFKTARGLVLRGINYAEKKKKSLAHISIF